MWKERSSEHGRWTWRQTREVDIQPVRNPEASGPDRIGPFLAGPRAPLPAQSTPPARRHRPPSQSTPMQPQPPGNNTYLVIEALVLPASRHATMTAGRTSMAHTDEKGRVVVWHHRATIPSRADAKLRHRGTAMKPRARLPQNASAAADTSALQTDEVRPAAVATDWRPATPWRTAPTAC